MTLAERLTSHLGDPVNDSEEETFILYSRPRTTHSLGFIDPKASSVDVVIHDKDYTVHQSPSILSSSRAGGTTGAVLWAITPLFASWISSPAPLAFLPPANFILELGCGISPLNALAIASPSSSSSSSTNTNTNSTSRRYILTDQPYVSRFIARNLEENEHLLLPSSSSKRSGRGGRATRGAEHSAPWKIEFKALDWETDTVSGVLEGEAAEVARGFDLVLACDCVYNEALIEPLVQTCADACALRHEIGQEEEEGGLQSTACVVAQQLRDDTVFEAWLAAFMGKFEAWRVPEEILPDGLRVEDGFVIYVGILKH